MAAGMEVFLLFEAGDSWEKVCGVFSTLEKAKSTADSRVALHGTDYGAFAQCQGPDCLYHFDGIGLTIYVRCAIVQ
jgi:hypothetical protein